MGKEILQSGIVLFGLLQEIEKRLIVGAQHHKQALLQQP